MAIPFVGRVSELELLAADLSSLDSGRGGLAIIVGEPGIGKTRLADEVAARAIDHDFVVHWGRCWQGGGAPAFWPWIQLLRSCVQTPLAAEDEAVVAWARSHVEALIGRADSNPGEATQRARENEQARFRLFDAITTLLHAYARSHPLLLVLDDLHDADEASLLLLQFLARDLRRSAILIVATCRPTEIQRSPMLTRTFAAFARESRTITLKGLQRSEIDELLDTAGNHALDTGTRDEVCRMTEGNPFFLDEVVRGLLARREGGAARIEIPFTVKEAIRQRLGPLPECSKAVLEAAAALGRDFDRSLLARVVLIPASECRLALEEAARFGLVEMADASHRLWRFVHVLIRETLREDTAAPAAQKLHLRIAAVLAEDRRAGRPVHTGSLAHHLVEALPLSAPSVVFDALVDSAREAMSALAYEEAAREFAHAIDIFEESVAPPGAGDDCPEAANDAGAIDREDPERLCVARLARVLMEYASSLRCSGHLPKARQTWRRAASLLTPLCREKDASTATRELFARAVLGFGKVSETGQVDEELVALLLEAIVVIGEADSPIHASLLARLAMALYFESSSGECLRLGERAVRMAERVGNARAHIDALLAQHFVLWRPGTAADRLKVADSLIDLCKRCGEKEAGLEARLSRLTDLMELGQVSKADLERRRYEADAEAARLPVHRWHAALLRSTFAFLEGRSGEAERDAETALSLGVGAGLPNAEPFHLAQSLQIRSSVGESGALEPFLRRIAAALPSMPVWTLCAAEAALSAGHESEARRDYERFAADGFAAVPRDGMWLSCMTLLSRLAVRLGDVQGAACLHDLLLPYQDSWVVAAAAISVPGPVRLFLGILCGGLGDADAAAAHFETAAELGRLHRCASVATECETELARLGGKLRTQAPAPPDEAVFRRGDDFWTLSAGDHALRLRDSKGLRYIHYLIENPEKNFHVFDLVTAVEGAAPVLSGANDATLEPGTEGDTGPVVDVTAMSAYKNRLREINADLSQAEGFNDSGRIEVLKAEREFVSRELASALGLGGRQRRGGSPSEQVRVRVTKVIGLAMRRIADADPFLGRVLAREIRTGTFCVYRPDPDRPIRWITRLE